VYSTQTADKDRWRTAPLDALDALDDRQLIEYAQHGNLAAYEELVSRY
jgi:hypothetical protein